VPSSTITTNLISEEEKVTFLALILAAIVPGKLHLGPVTSYDLRR